MASQQSLPEEEKEEVALELSKVPAAEVEIVGPNKKTTAYRYTMAADNLRLLLCLQRSLMATYRGEAREWLPQSYRWLPPPRQTIPSNPLERSARTHDKANRKVATNGAQAKTKRPRPESVNVGSEFQAEVAEFENTVEHGDKHDSGALWYKGDPDSEVKPLHASDIVPDEISAHLFYQKAQAVLHARIRDFLQKYPDVSEESEKALHAERRQPPLKLYIHKVLLKGKKKGGAKNYQWVVTQTPKETF